MSVPSSLYNDLKELYMKDIKSILTHNEDLVLYLNVLLKRNHITISVEEDTSLPIDYMDFSVRTHNCLKRANVVTLKHLYQLTQEQLESIRNLNKRCVEEVNKKLDFLKEEHGYLKEELNIVHYTIEDKQYSLEYFYNGIDRATRIIYNDIFNSKDILINSRKSTVQFLTYMTLIKGYLTERALYKEADQLMLELENNLLKEDLVTFKNQYEELIDGKTFHIKKMLGIVDQKLIDSFIKEHNIKSLDLELYNSRDLLIQFLLHVDYDNQFFQKCYFGLIEDIFEDDIGFDSNEKKDWSRITVNYINYIENYISCLVDKKKYHLAFLLLTSIHAHGLCAPQKEYIDNLLQSWYRVWDRILKECKEDEVIEDMKSYILDQTYFIGTKKEDYNIELFLKYFNEPETKIKKQRYVDYHLQEIYLQNDVPDEYYTWLYLVYKLDMDVNKYYEMFKDVPFIRWEENLITNEEENS